MVDEPTTNDRGMSSDGAIEVHFDPNGGHLMLGCEADAFERFRDFTAQEAALGSLYVEVGRITAIEIVDVSRRSDQLSVNRDWRDRVALVGCALASFLMVFLLSAGVIQVIAWFRG